MNIVVRKDVRNLGIASSLLEHSICLAKTLNCSSITLEVNETNFAAISLYKKFEFETLGKRKNYYRDGASAIIMTKLLHS